MGKDFQIQAKAFANGDWSVVLNTAESVETALETDETQSEEINLLQKTSQKLKIAL